MPLINCDTCGGSVATTAVACPHCGATDFAPRVETKETYTFSHNENCESCRGGKNEYGVHCNACGGTGVRHVFIARRVRKDNGHILHERKEVLDEGGTLRNLRLRVPEEFKK